MIAHEISSEVLILAAHDVFETMVYMDLQELSPGRPAWSAGSILATITFNGGISGCFGVCCEGSGAAAITRSMLGMGPEDRLELSDVQDAMGEVANMVMGNLKTCIADICGEIQISVPTVYRGLDIQHCMGDTAQEMFLNCLLEQTHAAELSLLWR